MPDSRCESSRNQRSRFSTAAEKTELQIPIAFITAHGDIPMTVKAMKSGASTLNSLHGRPSRGLRQRHSRQKLSLMRIHILQPLSQRVPPSAARSRIFPICLSTVPVIPGFLQYIEDPEDENSCGRPGTRPTSARTLAWLRGTLSCTAGDDCPMKKGK